MFGTSGAGVTRTPSIHNYVPDGTLVPYVSNGVCPGQQEISNSPRAGDVSHIPPATVGTYHSSCLQHRESHTNHGVTAAQL